MGHDLSVMLRARMRTYLKMSLLLALTLLLLTSMAAAAQKPKYGGTLVAAAKADIKSFCPIIAGVDTGQITSKIFEALLYFDHEMNPRPLLAESWKISTDRLEYTFNLVRNATWNDGKPFTSADVKWSFEEVLIKLAPFGRTLDMISSIEAPDPYTVKFKLSSPVPFLIFLEFYNAPIMPKHIYEGTDILNNSHNFKDPVGTGPFKAQEWVRGQYITLVRNELYRKRGQPYLDKLIYRIIPDAHTRTVALQAGEVDLLFYGVPFGDMEALQKTPNVVCSTTGYEMSASVFKWRFNLENPILGKKEVRQAIAYAMDKEEIVKKGTYGLSSVINGIFSDELRPYLNPDLKPMYVHNHDKANELLDKAGYPRGANGIRFKTSITYESNVEDVQKVCEILRSQLNDVGIELELVPMELRTLENKVYGRLEFDSNIIKTTSGPDPLTKSYVKYHSSMMARARAIAGLGVDADSNIMGYNNSRVDALYDEGLKQPDEKKRAQILWQIEQIILEDAPDTTIMRSINLFAWKSQYHGGISTWARASRADYADVWWEGGSSVSPEDVLQEIQNAEKELANLKAQYYNVGEAMKKVDEAKKAYEGRDWLKAYTLAREARTLAEPPTAMYAVVTIAVAVVVIGAIVYRRRKMR